MKTFAITLALVLALAGGMVALSAPAARPRAPPAIACEGQRLFPVGLACARSLIGCRSMLDISLLALTRAWVATVVAVAVLLASFAIEQGWNSAVYWRALPQAIELSGDEGPSPIRDQWNWAAAGSLSSRPPAGRLLP